MRNTGSQRLNYKNLTHMQCIEVDTNKLREKYVFPNFKKIYIKKGMHFAFSVFWWVFAIHFFFLLIWPSYTCGFCIIWGLFCKGLSFYFTSAAATAAYICWCHHNSHFYLQQSPTDHWAAVNFFKDPQITVLSSRTVYSATEQLCLPHTAVPIST